jgi:hypothetical protein
LPGDDLVPDPTMSDTRGITIDAPPSAVWPWLLQLGFGRGGWYSYDAMDMKGRSADAILPEHQQLAVGDVVPTDPNGGFEVRVLEPEHAIVLYVDNEIVGRRTDRARLEVTSTPGLAASGRYMQRSMPPEFSVSWAFVLEHLDGGRTRLIERVRLAYGSSTRGTRALGPTLGFGVFLMTRRQMLGLAERATRYAADPLAHVATTTPAAATWLAGDVDPQHDLTDVVPTPPTREGPAPANGKLPDLKEATPAP